MGPYSRTQIQTFIGQGLAFPHDLVWAEGWTTWLPLSQVPGLDFQSSPPKFDSPPSLPSPRDVLPSSGVNLICVWMHLSQFTAFLTLCAGYILPILIWQLNKGTHPVIDKQGRIIANWIITSLIYDLIVILLCFFWIGFLVAPFLALAEVIFPIIGAVKASRGEVWDYPMNINFFKV